MALLQGQLHPDITSLEDRASVSGSVTVFEYPWKRAHDYLDDVNDFWFGPKTYHPQTITPLVKTGQLAMDFFTDFYSRFYIIPNPLFLGDVISDGLGKIIVWNANIYNQTINSVTVAGLTPDTNFDTEFFTITTPNNFAVLQWKSYPWSVDKTGEDNISVNVEVSTTSGNLTLPINGRRGVFFSASPLVKFTHKYSFKTRITESFNGEQRSSLATIPQEKFVYKASIKSLDRYNFQANLHDAARLSVSIPMWEDYMLHGYVPVNTTYIENFDGDFLGRPFYVGGVAVLWQDEITFNLVKIKEVSPDGMRLDFEQPTEVELTNAFLIPVRVGVIVDPVKVKSDGINHHIVEVSISSLEHQPDFDRGVNLETFEGQYVLTSPNFQKTNTEQFGVDYDTFEGVGGDRAVFLDRGYREFKSKYMWRCFDRESLNELREFIFATRGKWKSFWLPRFGNDLFMTAIAVKDQPFIECATSKFVTDRKNIIGQAIMIHRKDGTREFYRITNVEPQGDTLRVSIGSVLPSNLSPEDVFSLCIMDLVRLSSDNLTVTVKDIGDISCSLSVLGVNDG